MNPRFNLTEITEKYRLLGLPVGADREQLRLQRNKMMMLFHPDRHPTGWTNDKTPLEERIHLIQSAYKFLTVNFDAIQNFLGEATAHCLTQRISRVNRSHWIYSEIETYDKTHHEIALRPKQE